MTAQKYKNSSEVIKYLKKASCSYKSIDFNYTQDTLPSFENIKNYLLIRPSNIKHIHKSFLCYELYQIAFNHDRHLIKYIPYKFHDKLIEVNMIH